MVPEASLAWNKEVVYPSGTASWASFVSAPMVLAFHISNNHVDLRLVTAALAEANSLAWIETRTPSGPERAVTGAQWILMSRDSTKLSTEALRRITIRPTEHRKILWTDDYSPLFDVLK